MTLAYDIVVGGAVTIMMFMFHRIGVEIFAPDNTLYQATVPGTEVLDGAETMTYLFEVITIWMPVLFIAAIWAWVAIRSWRRMTQTAVQRPT